VSQSANPEPSYTDQATAAVLAAVEQEHDFGGWLASVLAAAAAELGSSNALTAGRPGSWEADHIRGLVKGTVGWDDDYLSDYKRS
jgi:hypothetical protein